MQLVRQEKCIFGEMGIIFAIISWEAQIHGGALLSKLLYCRKTSSYDPLTNLPQFQFNLVAYKIKENNILPDKMRTFYQCQDSFQEKISLVD